jgi:hypothetical protein
MLPCALCRAPRWKTHGKKFAVRQPLFPVVTPLASGMLPSDPTVTIRSVELSSTISFSPIYSARA